jgi:hypothetical protein
MKILISLGEACERVTDWAAFCDDMEIDDCCLAYADREYEITLTEEQAHKHGLRI